MKFINKMKDLLKEARHTIEHCPCEIGCPSCIGTDVSSRNGKIDAIRLLTYFMMEMRREIVMNLKKKLNIYRTVYTEQ